MGRFGVPVLYVGDGGREFRGAVFRVAGQHDGTIDVPKIVFSLTCEFAGGIECEKWADLLPDEYNNINYVNLWLTAV